MTEMTEQYEKEAKEVDVVVDEVMNLENKVRGIVNKMERALSPSSGALN